MQEPPEQCSHMPEQLLLSHVPSAHVPSESQNCVDVHKEVLSQAYAPFVTMHPLHILIQYAVAVIPLTQKSLQLPTVSGFVASEASLKAL